MEKRNQVKLEIIWNKNDNNSNKKQARTKK